MKTGFRNDPNSAVVQQRLKLFQDTRHRQKPCKQSEPPPPDAVAQKEGQLYSDGPDAIRDSLDFFCDNICIITDQLLEKILGSQALAVAPSHLFALLRQCFHIEELPKIILGSGIIGEIMTNMSEPTTPENISGAMKLIATAAKSSDAALTLMVSNGVADFVSSCAIQLIEGPFTGPSADMDCVSVFDAVTKAVMALVRPIYELNIEFLENMCSVALNRGREFWNSGTLGMTVSRRFLKFVTSLWEVCGDEWLLGRRDMIEYVLEQLSGDQFGQVGILRTLTAITSRCDQFSEIVLHDGAFLEKLQLFQTEEARKLAVGVLRNVSACDDVEIVKMLMQGETIAFVKYVLLNDPFENKTGASVVLAYLIIAGCRGIIDEFMNDEEMTRQFTSCFVDVNNECLLGAGLYVLCEIVMSGEERAKATGSRNKVAMWIDETVRPDFLDLIQSHDGGLSEKSDISSLGQQFRQLLDDAALFDAC